MELFADSASNNEAEQGIDASVREQSVGPQLGRVQASLISNDLQLLIIGGVTEGMVLHTLILLLCQDNPFDKTTKLLASR